MSKKYKSHKGLAERQLKKRLLKKGWEVWRAGCINFEAWDEIYPNVLKKLNLLSASWGMSNLREIRENAFLS